MSDRPIRVTVSHRFAASPERVFDAWLDPAKARRFLFATDATSIVRAETDPRVGGRFVFVDRRAEGEMEHTGEYVEIDRPRRLVFTFCVPSISPDHDLVTLDFAPDGEGCLLTLTTEMKPEWADWADRTREGWALILQGLERGLVG